MAPPRGGWDSSRGAGPAPSGKRRVWLRFGPFGATSVVPPTEAPGGEIPAPQEDSTEPPSLPPGRPAAAQGLPPGRPGVPPPAGSPPRPRSSQAPLISGLGDWPGHSGHSHIHKNMTYISQPFQIHHVLRGQEWHHLTPGLDCSHGQITPLGSVVLGMFSGSRKGGRTSVVECTRPSVAYWS